MSDLIQAACITWVWVQMCRNPPSTHCRGSHRHRHPRHREPVACRRQGQGTTGPPLRHQRLQGRAPVCHGEERLQGPEPLQGPGRDRQDADGMQGARRHADRKRVGRHRRSAGRAPRARANAGVTRPLLRTPIERASHVKGPKALVTAVDPLYVSDHLSWSRTGRFNSHRLRPAAGREQRVRQRRESRFRSFRLSRRHPRAARAPGPSRGPQPEQPAARVEAGCLPG